MKGNMKNICVQPFNVQPLQSHLQWYQDNNLISLKSSPLIPSSFISFSPLRSHLTDRKLIPDYNVSSELLVQNISLPNLSRYPEETVHGVCDRHRKSIAVGKMYFRRKMGKFYEFRDAEGTSLTERE